MYLTGECVQQDLPPQLGKGLGKSGVSSAMLKGFSKSHDNLTRYNSAIDLTQAPQQLNEPSKLCVMLYDVRLCAHVSVSVCECVCV